MRDQLVPTIILIALLVLAGIGMLLGWRRLQRRQADIGTVAALPADPGVPTLTADALYVATTLRDQPLQRVAVQGLGMRARSTVQVFPGGVSLAIQGRDAAWIPAAELDSAGRATYAIDKGVEPGGLVRIAWQLGGTAVDTYLRPASPADGTSILDAVQRIARGSIASSPDTSEREN
ncbi:hypothetical protein [Naasia aerilata]|uniref:PH domain-containing protein n=1 Tax=Naasia aerilata TaxID=1162966 RepID=A0ABN6XUB9_9MICO|nr:hypothetical protein [Naasia aerilata]BDZ46973.1 hypothetical protein GCM10025866_28820 [Naasia aerilata]